jgi:hypothetical protein
VKINGTRIVCEIKQIDPNDDDRQIFSSVNARQATFTWFRNRLSDKLKDVSAQLKTASRSSTPTMLVVYNNTPSFNYTQHSEVVQAMFGQKSSVISFPDAEDAEPRVSRPFFGGQKRMTANTNTSVSVVAVLHSQGEQPKLRVYHNPFAATPLAPGIFDGLPVDQPVRPDTEETEA